MSGSIYRGNSTPAGIAPRRAARGESLIRRITPPPRPVISTRYPPDRSEPNEPNVTDLTEELGAWDGKSAAPLQSIYERHGADEDFVATILARFPDANLQRAATWLLKRHLELGNPLSARECRSILGSLSVQQDWESRLHLLQCLPHLSIPDEDRVGLEQFLDACVRSDKKFVRAWAYSGYNELALRFPQTREAVDGLLARAAGSEAASVRARIRNLRKGR